MAKKNGLTAKQARFVEEYLIDLNATQAAIRAGYAKSSAEVTGCRLLTKGKITDLIDAAKAERSERARVTQDDVVVELARIGFADMRDFATWGSSGVKLAASEGLTEDQTRVVSELSWNKDGGLKFKLHDKLSGLDKLGRHLKMFTDKHEHTGADGGPIEVEDKELARRIMTLLGMKEK